MLRNGISIGGLSLALLLLLSVVVLLASATSYVVLHEAHRKEAARFEAEGHARVNGAARLLDRELRSSREGRPREADLQPLLEALIVPGQRLVLEADDGQTIAAAGEPASDDSRARFSYPLTEADWLVSLESTRPRALQRHGRFAAMHLAALGVAALLIYLASRRVMTSFTGDIKRIHRALVDVRNGVFSPSKAPPAVREAAVLLPDIASVAAELRERHSAVTAESITDSLTGLYNRRYFDIMLTHAFEQSSRRPATYLVVLDLVGFRAVNERHGRHTGDLLLGRVARFLQARVRRSDTAARLGDDRFALLLNNVLPDAMVPWLAQVLEAFDTELRRGEPGDTGRVASALAAGFAPVDVAVYATPDDVLRAAHQALYRAKQAKARGSRLQPPAPEAHPHGAATTSRGARATS